MASDIHLKLGDIKGESPDDKHKDEIEVLSWSWRMTQPSTMSSGGGGGGGKAAFDEISVTHHVDKATPNLMKFCATGEHIKEGTLTVRKAGKQQQEYLVVKLKDVLITEVAPKGDGNDGGQMLETFKLSPVQVELEYKPQKADGSLDSAIKFGYDIKAKKEL